MKLSEYAKQNNIGYQTAWLHYKKGLIKGKQLQSGTIVIEDSPKMTTDDILHILEHWKVARSRLNKDEIKENLRCAVDLVQLLKSYNVIVDRSIYDNSD
jgi:hypothetical protein